MAKIEIFLDHKMSSIKEGSYDAMMSFFVDNEISRVNVSTESLRNILACDVHPSIWLNLQYPYFQDSLEVFWHNFNFVKKEYGSLIEGYNVTLPIFMTKVDQQNNLVNFLKELHQETDGNFRIFFDYFRFSARKYLLDIVSEASPQGIILYDSRYTPESLDNILMSWSSDYKQMSKKLQVSVINAKDLEWIDALPIESCIISLKKFFNLYDNGV